MSRNVIELHPTPATPALPAGRAMRLPDDYALVMAKAIEDLRAPDYKYPRSQHGEWQRTSTGSQDPVSWISTHHFTSTEFDYELGTAQLWRQACSPYRQAERPGTPLWQVTTDTGLELDFLQDKRRRCVIDLVGARMLYQEHDADGQLKSRQTRIAAQTFIGDILGTYFNIAVAPLAT